MLIGRLSELTGVTRKTIRHYESIGLIPLPNRKGSYRVYTEEYIPIINLIKRAQLLGFSLDELREVVAEKYSTGEFPMQLASGLIDRKSKETKEEIIRLTRLENDLAQLKQDLFDTFK